MALGLAILAQTWAPAQLKKTPLDVDSTTLLDGTAELSNGDGTDSFPVRAFSVTHADSERSDLCGTCHDWQKHATHPIGPSIKDPRNKNLSLECASCHRAHGTGAKHLIPFAKVTDLCTSCHEQYRR